MKKAYVDTNIFDYAALRNQTYGKACLEILEGIGKEFDATCSIAVPFEILGSLSRENLEIAQGTITGFFSFDIRVVGLTKDVLMDAAEITRKTGIDGYDAVHVATMRSEGLTAIITKNYANFKKIKDIDNITPLKYKSWL